MLAAALPHASQAEANVAVTALRSLLSPADSGPSTFPSTTSASRTSSAAPAPLLGKPAASALRPSRAAAPFSDNSKSDQPPPAMPASLSRPVQYVSSLNVDDFRLAGSSASETEKTFRHALTQLSNEMSMLRDITHESRQLLRNMYEPPAQQQQSGNPTLSVHTAYRQQKQINAVRRDIDELSDATKEQERALDEVLSHTEDSVRRVTALQQAEERNDDEEWREMVRNQPLSREAVQLTERIEGQLALKQRRQELEEAVADEWKRVKGHGRVGYNEDELTVASVHRIVDSHRALIEKQRDEVRRLKAALRRGQGRTSAEEREPRLLFSETPLKGLAGKRGWEKEEKKYSQEDEQKRPSAQAYGRGLTPAKAPIVEAALQQRASASPSYTTPVSRQRPRSSAQFTSSPPSLTPATLSRLNASFQQKLLQSSANSPPGQSAADRQQGAERIAQLLRRSEEARARAQVAFLSPLPSTLQLRSGGGADRGRGLPEAMAEGSGGRRWARNKPQHEKDREEEERKEQEKERARQEEAKQMMAQLQRSAQSEAPQDGSRSKRAAPGKLCAPASAPSGFAPGFSFSGLNQPGPNNNASTAAPPPFSFQFKAPPAAVPVETVEKKEPPPAKPVFASLSPPASGKPAAPRAALSSPASSSTGAQTAKLSTAAATAAAEPASVVLPESPSLAKRRDLTVEPPPAVSAPVPPKPAKPTATPSAAFAAPAGKPASAAPGGLFSPSAATASAASSSAAASAASSSATFTASSSSAPSTTSASASSTAAAAAPAFTFSTSAAAPSFSFSTSAAAPSFSFSTAAAAPSFSFSTPSASASSSTSLSASSLSASTPSALAADKTPAKADTRLATAPTAAASSASATPSFGFGSSLGASTTSSFASPFAAASSPATTSSFSFASPAKTGADAFGLSGLSGLTSALSDSSSAASSSPFGSSSASPFASAFPAPSAAAVANPFAAFASTASSLSFGTPSAPSTVAPAAASPFATPSFDTASASASSLRAFGSAFGATGSSASNPFQTSAPSSNPFQAAPSSNGMAVASNPFAMPAQPILAQPSPFGAATPSPAPTPSASPFATQSFGGIASPFDSSAVFGSGGFGQSFSSAAFGGGMAGSSASNPFAQPAAPAAGVSGGGFGAFASGDGAGAFGGGGGGFSSFGNGAATGQSGFASFAPPAGSGFGSFAQPAAAGGGGFGALTAGGAAGGLGTGGGFGGAAAPTGGFGSFGAAAPQSGGSGGGWGLGGGTGVTLPQSTSFSGFRS